MTNKRYTIKANGSREQLNELKNFIESHPEHYTLIETRFDLDERPSLEEVNRFIRQYQDQQDSLDPSNIFDSATLERQRKFLPNLDWQKFLPQIQDIVQDISTVRQCTYKVYELLCDLKGLLLDAPNPVMADRCADVQKEPNEDIKDEFYQLASELVEQLTKFEETHE